MCSCLLSVDTLDMDIVEPYPYEAGWSKRWYSHKTKKAALRYEIGLSIINGDICWLNGPFAAGVYNDWEIFNKLGLKNQLEVNERVEADDGYGAGDPEFCKTPSGVIHDEQHKAIRRRVMGRQEAINKNFREWNCLKKVFRHDIAKHSIIFHTVAVICQLKIENGHPLYSCADYSD